jgi:hypothetical protein
MTKIDETGDLLHIKPDGLVKLDGIVILRRVEHNGKLYLQFCDSDRMRSQLRKTRFVEIPIGVLVSLIEKKNNGNEHVAHHPME